MHGVYIPETIYEYIIWAKDELDVDFESKDCKATYDISVTSVLAAAEAVFGRRLGKFLGECEKQYSKDRGFDLFMTSSESQIEWIPKPYQSVLDRSYRYNVIENLRWPKAPSGGWMKPENWFSKLNDTVRTRIVCKYIDGPKFLAERLTALAKSSGLDSDYRSRQKDDGYYAYHFYAKIPANVLIGAKLEEVKVDVEIQITTQLQEVMADITHPYYEERRTRRESDPSAWKWEIETNRFRVGYLGHTLHLLEAIILEARNEGSRSAKK